MSKGILLLEWMPSYCSDCIFCYERHQDGSWCELLNERVFNQWGKLDMCPLKELPEKQVRDYPEYDRYVTGWDDGWDACLDEILGEEDYAN